MDNLLIQNNVFISVENGIYFDDQTDGVHSNHDYMNNSFFDCDTYGIYFRGTFTNSKIVNNAIDGNGNTTTGIHVTAHSSATYDYNDIFDCTSAYGGVASAGSDDKTTDPLFVSPTDLKVQDNSPCLDAGAGVGTHAEVPTDDYRDQARPVDLVLYPNVTDGTDIGAYEMTSQEITDTCWSFTARYENSNKLFRVNGPDVFPKNLRVPKNVNISTGKMIDEGKLIDPSKYKILQ